MVVLVELGRAEVEIALSGLLVEEGILKHDVLLEGLPCAHEGMSDIDAVFKRGLLEELEDQAREMADMVEARWQAEGL